jgi:hypothetical protein
MKLKNLILAPFVIAGLAMPASAFAAKADAYAPTLTTSFSGAAGSLANSSYVVSGCGFNASFGGVTVVVYEPAAVAFAGSPVDAGGCISVSNFWTQGAGTYKFLAWQHVGKKDAVVASTSFVVG